MKTMFVNVLTRHEPDYAKLNDLINDIPEGKVAICYSNQFSEVAKKIQDNISKEVVLSIQTLGCSNPKFSKDVEAIIIVGQGKFHTVSLAYESSLPTYVVEGNSLWKVKDEDIEKMRKKEQGALLKYLNSDKIGILVATKPGQQRLNKAMEFKNSLKDKRGYIFLANNIDTNQFENFGIDCWVNTACPRMDLNEGNIINLEKIPN